MANLLALGHGRPCVLLRGPGAILLDEGSGPVYRIDDSSLSWTFTMS